MKVSMGECIDCDNQVLDFEADYPGDWDSGEYRDIPDALANEYRHARARLVELHKQILLYRNRWWKDGSVCGYDQYDDGDWGLARVAGVKLADR